MLSCPSVKIATDHFRDKYGWVHTEFLFGLVFMTHTRMCHQVSCGDSRTPFFFFFCLPASQQYCIPDRLRFVRSVCSGPPYLGGQIRPSFTAAKRLCNYNRRCSDNCLIRLSHILSTAFYVKSNTRCLAAVC